MPSDDPPRRAGAGRSTAAPSARACALLCRALYHTHTRPSAAPHGLHARAPRPDPSNPDELCAGACAPRPLSIAVRRRRLCQTVGARPAVGGVCGARLVVE